MTLSPTPHSMPTGTVTFLFTDIEGSTKLAQEQIEYEKQIADLRAGLGDESFNQCWDAGKSMTMEQAIQLALS